MRELFIADLGYEGFGPIYLNAECIFDVATGKSLATFMSEMETLKEAITIFFKGPIKESGNIDRLSEIVAELEANKKKIAALNKGSMPPSGYEQDGAKIVPVTILLEGNKPVPDAALTFVVSKGQQQT